jgi:hypothetical protein
MKYLTRSYVEALGLREVAGHELEDPQAGWVSPEAVKPHTTAITFVPGVIYGEQFYKRSQDGLSYDLTGAAVHVP